MNVELRIRRLIAIANHVNPDLVEEPEKTCNICGYSILHPYHAYASRIHVENGDHWVCIEAQRNKSYDLVNDLYFVKDSQGRIRTVFE